MIYDAALRKKIKLDFLAENKDIIEDIHVIAEHEHKIHSLRIKKALELKKLEGKPMGRPTIEEGIQERIHQLYYNQKYTMRQIALEIEVSLGTVFKYISKMKNEMQNVS